MLKILLKTRQNIIIFKHQNMGFTKKDLITLHVLVNSTSNKKNKEGKNISNNTDHLVNNQCEQTTEK